MPSRRGSDSRAATYPQVRKRFADRLASLARSRLVREPFMLGGRVRYFNRFGLLRPARQWTWRERVLFAFYDARAVLRRAFRPFRRR